ncbi:hypothetical protein ACFX2C_044387 [Malus domestica]
MPTSVLLDKSPFEVLFGVVPQISHLRIFGCACYPLLKPYLSNKLQPKTIKCVFLGYASQYKGYICYDASGNRTYISRHVIFDEHDYPFPALSMSKSSHPSSVLSPPSSSFPTVTNTNVVVLPVSNVHSNLDPPPTVSTSIESCIPVSQPSPLSSSSSSFVSPSPLSITGTLETSPSIPVVPESNVEEISSAHMHHGSSFQPKVLQVVLEVPLMNVHPMQTRSKSGIVKKKALLTTLQESGGIDLSLVEPLNYKTALTVPVWMNAMTEEIDALYSQGT